MIASGSSLLGRLTAIAIWLFLIPMPAHAQADPRIVEHDYSPDAVYQLSISQGRASVILLEKDEIVESIVVGDARSWSVEATSSADRVVVKPAPGAAATNMMVLTTKRTYAFSLSAFGGMDTFLMRFRYPGDAAKAGRQVEYRLRGDRELFPRLITDNGQTTSIFWAQDTAFPAVFVVDEQGDEIAPTYRSAGDGLILDGVHDRIVFRSGKAKATATMRKARSR